MSSPEARLKPDRKKQVNDAAGVVQPAGSESKERPNTRTASHAESLLAAEKRTLEMIADGASLKDILNDLCSSIDVEASPVIATVLLMDPDGERLWHTAGNRVPRDWLPVISPLTISPHAGCCGAAAFLKERVIVADVATDINWLDEYRGLAIKNGIRAAWSEPILTKDGEVLGTFALYSSEPRIPAGNQTIQVWHEVYGSLTQTVDVKAGGTTEVSFTYTGNEHASSTDGRVQEAVIPEGATMARLAPPTSH